MAYAWRANAQFFAFVPETFPPKCSSPMKAAVLYGKKDVRVEEVAQASLKPGQVRIRIEAALTCGTDLKVFKRGYHAKMIVPPAMFGHELAGVISEVQGLKSNGQSQEWNVGDRVVVANSAPCGKCFHCRNQQENICDDLLFLNGAYAQSIVVPARIVEKNLLRLKPATNFRDAALVEDRKSTRLNSSHLGISYAVFCLKKKTNSPGTDPPGRRGSGSARRSRRPHRARPDESGRPLPLDGIADRTVDTPWQTRAPPMRYS